MRKRSNRASPWQYQPDINLNSFLDLILNVLLFFIFATEIAAFHALEVTIPSSQSANSESHDKNEIIVYISQDNRINVNGQYFDKAEFTSWLQKTTTSNSDEPSLIVRGDLESNLQTTVDVLTACKIAKINKIKVETKQP